MCSVPVTLHFVLLPSTYFDCFFILFTLGLEGGEALGNALHTNNSLTHINVSHNNITSRACFTILCGVRYVMCMCMCGIIIGF